MSPERVSHLVSLGLTEYESKALLSLTEKESLEAPDISRRGGIPKTRVYDVLEKLEEKNLVISMQGRPKKYHAIETEKIIGKLVEENRKKFKEIEKNAFKLKEMLSFGEREEAKENILRVKNLIDFDKILQQEVMKAKKSVIGFTEIKEKKFLEEAMGKAVEKRVKVQLISNKGTENFLNEKISSKNSVHSLNAFVIDGKKTVLGLDSFNEKKPHYHFAILQNKSLAEAITSHFNEKWNKR